MAYCQIIVDISHEDVDHLFTYRIPPKLHIEPGMRVRVPFGHIKHMEGIVINVMETCDLTDARIRDVEETLEDYPIILPNLLKLSFYIRDHVFCTMTQALRLMYPAEMRAERVHSKQVEIIALSVSEAEAEQRAALLARAPKRLAILTALLGTEKKRMESSELKEKIGDFRPSLKPLLEDGTVTILKEEVFRKPYTSIDEALAPDLELTPTQGAVLSRINAAMDLSGNDFLLYGVTGSGKTEVFIHAIRHAIRAGKTAIVLVPEISLTPQMVTWFRSRFGDLAAVLHSRLSSGERYDEWRRIRRGEVKVVIGARSAIFAPLQNIGIIIVDEEHEQSYQSEKTPQYDAREIAEQRCHDEGAVLLLASATPSMRSFARSQRGDLTLLEMPERVNHRPLPEVSIVDMRRELSNGNRSVFSASLYNALSQCIANGKQAILFVNRRGYSSFISCRQCGTVIMCDHCDVSMTYHAAENLLRCHYCGAEKPVPETCPSCGSRHIKYFGVGTQRVEEEMHRFFPAVRTLRMDNDTTREKDAHALLLARFRKGEAQVLIGTQMIAKGLDFPNVTLVGIVAADAMLNLPDFRSSERTFQLLTQVSGRAGRSSYPGLVFLQTYSPEHYAIQAASRQDYRSFYEEEMQHRRRQLFPPYTVIIRNLYDAKDDEEAKQAAESGLEQMEAYFSRAAYMKKYVTLLRVMPAPIRRINERMRWQLILKIVDQPQTADAVRKMSDIALCMNDKVRCVCQINPSNLG